MRRAAAIALLLAIAAGLSACGETEEAAAPPPQEIAPDSIAYFCLMMVDEHAGPKGQIFLTDRDEPYWFASVRDTIAFTMLPGEPKNIAAIYVTDVGRAQNWDHPEPGTWIVAREAVYVIGSERKGGMGVAETVPFSDEDAAKAFIVQYGGRMVDFENLPEDYILGPGGEAPGREMMRKMQMDMDGSSMEPHSMESDDGP